MSLDGTIIYEELKKKKPDVSTALLFQYNIHTISSAKFLQYHRYLWPETKDVTAAKHGQN